MDSVLQIFQEANTNVAPQTLYYPKIVRALQRAAFDDNFIANKLQHLPYEYQENIFNLYYDDIVTDVTVFDDWQALHLDSAPHHILEFRLYRQIKASPKGAIPYHDAAGNKIICDSDFVRLVLPTFGVTRRLKRVKRPDEKLYLVIAADEEADLFLIETLKGCVEQSRAPISMLNKVPDATLVGNTLNVDQATAIRSLRDHVVTCVTGGAGTGKTTIILRLMELAVDIRKGVYPHLKASDVNPIYILCPTNMAAENIRSRARAMFGDMAMDFSVTTIHSFGYTHRAIQQEAIMVFEESSMYDNVLSQILGHNPHNLCRCRYLFIGDPQQLPPPARPSVFRRLLGRFRPMVINLRQNHRSEDLIIRNAQAILQASGNGHDPQDPQFCPITLLEGPSYQIRAHYLGVPIDWEALIAEAATRSPLDQIMVITHQNFDVLTINRALRPIFHRLRDPLYQPPSDPNKYHIGPIRDNRRFYGMWEWHIGDRCVSRVTHKPSGVHNGMVGEVVGIDRGEYINLTIQWLGKDLTTNVRPLSVWPAFCITVHNSQGQEWQTCIFADLNGRPLPRSLFYVGSTRAKKNQYVVRNLIGRSDGLARNEFLWTEDHGGSHNHLSPEFD